MESRTLFVEHGDIANPRDQMAAAFFGELRSEFLFLLFEVIEAVPNAISPPAERPATMRVRPLRDLPTSR